jgi:magnesium-protoporphyrin IX monomethyl ester (oxidative) cyclase
MRVCLINPPRIQPKLWGKPSAFQPLDIAYVAAVLEKHQHDVCIIDAPTEGWKNLQEIDGKKYRLGLTNEEIANRIRYCSPDVVVISVPFSGWWTTAFEVVSTVKSVDRTILTVLIGLHPSARPVQCLQHDDVDFVVMGEPEFTVLELVSELEKTGIARLEHVNGLGFIKDGRLIITSPRALIEDLDSLPFPARHLLPTKMLFAALKKRPIRGEIRKPYARVLTSRGCPNSCIFCSAHIVNGKKWRGRTPENVVKELEQLVKDYGVKQVDFEDDNLTFDKKRLEKICDLIVARRLNIEWYTPNGVRADGLDETLLKKMRASGCQRILIAPESGSQRVVNEIIRKNLDLRKVEEVVATAKRLGIKVGCFFILGLIGETKEDIKATIDYAYKLRRLGADRFYFSYATPLYGTELYEQAVKGGFLRPEFSDEALSEAQPLIETPEFTISELQELCAQANAVNPTFTFDRLKRALWNPGRAFDTLISRARVKRLKKNVLQ